MAPAGEGRGQALVEFALVIPIFLVLMVAIFDFGRGIYTYNGLSAAAREIARVTSVHPGSNFSVVGGRSAKTTAVIATQQGLVPGLTVTSMTCVDIDDTAGPANCPAGHRVKVIVSSTFKPVSLLGAFPTFTLSSTSSIQLQQGEG